jgi:N-acetylmuramoyl-L-alanine amidase
MLSVHVNAAGNGDWYNATGWSAWTTKGQNNSDKLADCLYEAAEEILKPLGKKLRYDMTDGDKDFESNFYVIKRVNCVACLTENFFMDNMNDVDWLLSL